MAKTIALLMIALMAVQLIKPLGLPGLRRRGDFWKIALFAMAVLGLTIGLREVWEALSA